MFFEALFKMKIKVLVILISSFLQSVVSIAYATNLLEVYELGLASDPLLQEAIARHRSVGEGIPQARSGLLPSLLGSGLATKINTRYANSPIPGEPLGSFSGNNAFYSLTLRQPIFNYTAWAQLKFAKANVKQSEAAYFSAVQDLMRRTADAYFQVLFATDALRLTQSQLNANKRHLEEAEHRFEVGLVAITDVYEAKSGYDTVVAREIEAKNNLLNKEEELRRITGQFLPSLAPLKNGVPLVKPLPERADDWVSAATKQNYTLIAAKFGAEAAKENIAVQRSEHLPRLNAIGSYNDAWNDSQNINAYRTGVAMGGVELNFPIYQGGFVSSKTRQAHYDHQGSLARYENAYRQTVVTTRQAFNSVILGISKIRADRQAVLSAKKQLESIEAQYKVGTRTLVNVLDAQREYISRQIILAQDQYEYLNATLQLKQAAGTLSVADLVRVNELLKTK